MSEVLDVLIVGGGPFGTAAAFRAQELGLKVLVIDLDDLMKRIRDYAKDKQILPDFGGGDDMQFPKGGKLIERLRFEPIDKDALCAEWKGLYQEFGVPSKVGVEMTGLKPKADVWDVLCWNHNTRAEEHFAARHVVLAMGRGVPRKLEVIGDLTSLAFSLKDAARYVGAPACVIGGGTSACEAVISISNAKAEGGDTSGVYWAYRGDKMPKINMELGNVFFRAFAGNGNISYLPKSEPVLAVGKGDESVLSLRTTRVEAPGQPTQTSHLEFLTRQTIACVGEDIPEPLLNAVGTPMVTGGPLNKKRLAVSPLLETRQPNVYLAGDILSPMYFETGTFDDPSSFVEIKRRGNITAALRDGVLIAEVIAQKLAGKTDIKIDLKFDPPSPAAEQAPAPVEPPRAAAPAPPAPVASATRSPCALVAILPSGTEANVYRLQTTGSTIIGRHGTAIAFDDDAMMSDKHASVTADGASYRVKDEGSARGTYLQPPPDRVVAVPRGGVVKAGNQWLMFGDQKSATAVIHFDVAGKVRGRHDVKEGSTIIGRESPDITISPDDGTLSRRHLAVVRRGAELAFKDLGSANGTIVRVSAPTELSDGDRLLVGQQVLQFTDERMSRRPNKRVEFDTHGPASGPMPPPPQARAAAPSPSPAEKAPAKPVAAPAAAPAPAAAAGGPSVSVKQTGKQVPCKKGQTVCEALEAAGVKVKADCHRGSCGMDAFKVLEGADQLGPISGTEKDTLEDLCSLQPGPYRLACVARVNGPIVIDFVKS